MREENDLSWGVGCNGIIYILLEKGNYIYQEYLRKVRGYTEKGLRVWMIKDLLKSKTLFLAKKDMNLEIGKEKFQHFLN
ncbi:hypothetical protein [Bacillus cereus]|uniref:hypothetical protein n=1 Tax=Bacillus cereus TaxID=1396 RepID=UPI003D65DEA4